MSLKEHHQRLNCHSPLYPNLKVQIIESTYCNGRLPTTPLERKLFSSNEDGASTANSEYRKVVKDLSIPKPPNLKTTQ